MTARLMFDKAVRLLDLGNNARGESCLRKALDLARAEEDLYDQAQILCCLGDFLKQVERDEEALRAFEAAIPIATAASLPLEEERARTGIAAIRARNHWDE